MNIRRRFTRATLALLMLASGLAVSVSSAGASPGISDDFNSDSLDTGLWTEVATVAGPTFTYTGAQAAIVIPPGSTGYAPWTSGNKAPTLRQSLTGDDRTGDIDVVVVFDSIPTLQAQTQGLIFADSTDSNKFLRFDVYFDGTDVRAFSADPKNSSAFLINEVVPSSSHAMYLRVTRDAGTNTWEFFTAATESPASWTSHGTFVRTMTVTEMGPFVGSSSPGGGAPVPGFVGVIDYFGDLPVPDGATGSTADTSSPVIGDVSTQKTTASLTISWTTSEPTISTLTNVTTTASTSSETETATYGVNHEATFTGLSINTSYNLRINSTDLNGNSDSSSFSATTSSNDDGPIIELFYGDEITVGSPSYTQRWVNILGNTSDPDGIGSLSYTLNGGSAVNMGIGADTRRLGASGDFNIDILVSALNVGANTVEITSTDTNAKATTREVTVNRVDDVVAPPAFALDWSELTSLTAATHPIDGKWTTSGAGLTVVEPEYDRLIGMGEQTWSDYEVLFPVTVHSINADADDSPSNGPGVGVFLRWNGHTSDGGGQPLDGFKAEVGKPTPFGALTWWQDPSAVGQPDQLRIIDVDDTSLITAASDTSFDLVLGTEYMIRAQAVGNFYRIKMWPSASSEPGSWALSFNGSGNAFDPDAGSIVLVAHEVSATFGDVLVVPKNASDAVKASNPVAEPSGGLANEGEAVQISVPSGAAVYYTTDGSTPSPLSEMYVSGVPVAETMKFISYETGKNASDVVTASFTFNEAPDVSAGADQATAPSEQVTLAGSVTDDAATGSLDIEWTTLSGPGTVIFADSTVASTTATFTTPGTYVLQLSADDGQVTRSDEVEVEVSALDGYWILNAAGAVKQFGSVDHHGDLSDGSLAAPASAIAPTASKDGYWVAQSNGAVTAYGDAFDAGGLDDLSVVPTFPIVSMARSTEGDGYYLLGEDGGVFAFNAPFYGSTGDIVLDLPVVSLVAHPLGDAYWFVARDGGIFAFGPEAGFYGSLPEYVPYSQLAADVVGMAVTATGKGYWLVAEDGGVFAFGDAVFHGSVPQVLPAGVSLAKPVVGIVATSTGDGYWMVAEDGGIFAFGDAAFLESDPNFGTVVGMAG
ncbi:MAG: hypothetical protein GY925_13235 [Actinomycetia bacterium]|nr:hypothetical protein [Actinomycetes bacterium]